METSKRKKKGYKQIILQQKVEIFGLLITIIGIVLLILPDYIPNWSNLSVFHDIGIALISSGIIAS